MPHVEDDFIDGAVKRAVHGDGEFHSAEAGGKMPPAARDVFNHILANLRRESGQLTILEMFKILKGIDFVESRVTIHFSISFLGVIAVFFLFQLFLVSV